MKKKKMIKIEYYYRSVETNKYTYVIIDNRIILLLKNQLKRVSSNYLLHHIEYKDICFNFFSDAPKIQEEIISGINSEDIRKALIKVINTTTGLFNLKKSITRFNEIYYNYKKYYDNFSTKLQNVRNRNSS